MSEEWGPWIEQDGAGIVGLLWDTQIMARYDDIRLIHAADGEELSEDSPNWFWRMKRVRVGWFKWELKRVCDDPAYSPISKFRIRKPKGLTILEALLTDLPEKVKA